MKRTASIVILNVLLAFLSGGPFAEAAGSATGTSTVSNRYIGVSGDREKYAEDHWIKTGFTGGMEDYNYIYEDTLGDSVVIDGRALAGNDDYFVDMDFKKEGVGNFTFEFQQLNKYYDGTGGYSSIFAPTDSIRGLEFETARDLSLKIGNMKCEAVFSEVEDTKVSGTYERKYRKGAKSLISWAEVTDGRPRFILPTFIEIDEITDRFAVGIDQKVEGIDLSLDQQFERTTIVNAKDYERDLDLRTGAITGIRKKFEDMDAYAYNAVFRASKDLNEQVFASAAVLYAHNRGRTLQTLTDPESTSYYPRNKALVDQDTITFLPQITYTPFEHLALDAGVRWDFVHKRGKSTLNQDSTSPPDEVIDQYINITDRMNEYKLSETLGVKYDGIDNIVIYGEGEMNREIRYENNTQNSTTTASNDFSRATDATTHDYAWTAGTKCYPVKDVNFTTACKFKRGVKDFNLGRHEVSGDIIGGERGYMNLLKYDKYEPFALLNVKPWKLLTCTLRYGFDTTRYGINTPASESTEYTSFLANNYSGGVTVTPHQAVFLSTFYQYRQALTTTPAHDNIGSRKLPIYNANYATLVTSCGYTPDKITKITGTYSFSKSENFNSSPEFAIITMPLGLDNFKQDMAIALEREIMKDMTFEIRYDMAKYTEDSNGGMDDYFGHACYTGLKVKF
ncbi:MAG: hypothetical protein HQL30_10360 [Candidatus Omnitrophica bacterium]|nr:hypothetical protein [Candidatus Omnitrophota bacterium]